MVFRLICFMTLLGWVRLGCYAPLKKRKVCSNRNKFMMKKMSAEVMTRSRLRNKYNKNRTYRN